MAQSNENTHTEIPCTTVHFGHVERSDSGQLSQSSRSDQLENTPPGQRHLLTEFFIYKIC
jgi:hypothetical protein